MEWIGQHIYDLVSRFRNDVYLEDISTGTIASGGNLGLDSNNKIVKATEAVGDITGVALTAATGIDLTSVSGATGGAYAATIGVDVSDFMASGVAGRVLTATGTDNMGANTYLTFTNDAGETDTSTLSVLSNQDIGDRFTIATTTHGATTLTTEDDDAAAAHFEIAADGDITLDSAGQIKLEPVAGNNILLDGTVTVDGGAVGGLASLTSSADLTITATGNDITLDSDTLVITSATTQRPRVDFIDTANDADGSRFRLIKNRGAAGQDDDLISALQFQSYNDAGTPELSTFAQILANITDATDGQESGSLTFQVHSHGGGMENGLVIKGGSQDDEVDVDVGLGTASVTTVAGDLSVTTGLILDSVDITTIQTSAESFVDNNTSLMTSAAIDDKVNTRHAVAQTGKSYRVLNCSFRDDIGTTKHYLPLKSQDEQTALTREEGTELAVCDGRVVSITYRGEQFGDHSGDATVTFGIETNTVGSSYSSGFSEVETEAITINDADDQHLWHAMFSSAKHWDSTDMFAISITASEDITGSNERHFITVVIEDDWATYLAGSTREIDTTP